MALVDLIASAAAARPAAITATQHAGGISTATCPQKFICSDGALYNVKFIQNQHGDGRGAFNEQVTGLCGALIDAPVPAVNLIDVSAAFTAALNRDPAAHHLNFAPQPGIHHGSHWAANHSDRSGLAHMAENKQRFGALEILYTWLTCTGDHQWIYANDPPHAVLSVDHSTFIPGGFGWTAAGIASVQHQFSPDPVFASVGLKDADRAPARARLAAVSEAAIAGVVARPPDAWGVTSSERLALAEFLLARRIALLAHYQSP
jgi:hypothetical protein